MGRIDHRANHCAVPRQDGAASPQRCSLPSPEDVFIAWLLWLPDGVDLPEAALQEVARLDRRPALSPGAERLRDLLLAVVRGQGRRQLQ